MKLASDGRAGLWLTRPPALEAVLTRLEELSFKPEFAGQRDLALSRALKPYVEGEAGTALAPLEEEADQARLILYCDFYPENGQLTLIEQLRDVITEHIGGDERRWLDPLKHSYLDLLEILAPPGPDRTLALRSLGDATVFMLPASEQTASLAEGHVLLTRVVRDPAAYESGKAVWAGSALVLSTADARALLDRTAEWRREMEMMSGSFALGEWQEYAKRYGHMILWAFAELRLAALVEAVRHIGYQQQNGEPYLYAVALYDHHEGRFLAEGLAAMQGWTEEPEENPLAGGKPVRRWIQRESDGGRGVTVGRITLTSAQLIVECDRPERLDAVKHGLAAAFGFSLHFRGETLTPPARKVTLEELAGDQPLQLVVTADEDQALLKNFLEEAYLEWSDQAHHALGGQTPRHAAASAARRQTVAALIDEMEASDPGLRRSGRRAYDYNVLRAHVGLDEAPR
jgi:hypothetical protein